MQPSPTSRLAFVLFCLTTVVMILRPGEMISGLAGVPIYEVLILSTSALSFGGLLNHFRVSSLQRQPVTLCLVGVFIAIPVSHLSHMYLTGAYTGAVEFFKAALLFALLLVVVDRWERFEILCRVIAGSALIMISLCLVDYLGIVELSFIRHVTESYGVEDTGDDIRIARMNGTGIFSDPNDISLLIVATGILCLSFLTDPQRGPLRVGWAAPIVMLAVALVCTRSRGGLLAAGAAIGALMLFRYGKKVAITIGVLGLLALPLMAGRQGSIDLSDGTGHDRILLWREGLTALRSAQLFFGIGQGLYQELDGLVAHNSFVHAYVELGIIGGTLFFGMFFFCALGLFRLNNPAWQIAQPRQARFLPYMAAIGGGWTIGLLSLSRCYTVSTLLIVALGAAYLNLAGWNLRPRRLVIQWDGAHAGRLIGASACLFIALNIFVRIMA